MIWVGDNLIEYAGNVVDNGQCVRFLQVAAGVPHTSTWKRGQRVREAAKVAPGTAIATFGPDGTYQNAEDGSSHAAFFLRLDPEGIMVCDQWSGQVVHARLIRFKDGEGLACDDGDAFHIIEAPMP